MDFFKRISHLFFCFVVLCTLVLGSFSIGFAAGFDRPGDKDFFDSPFWDFFFDPTKPDDPVYDKKAYSQQEGLEQNKKIDEKFSKKQDTAVTDKYVKSIDLVVILDKSGSMHGMEKDTIGGFNSMVEEQRKKDLPVHVTLVMFNQGVNKMYDRVPLAEVSELTDKDYIAQGTTALLDAVGDALSGLQSDESVNKEGNKVLVVITTDGYENASKEWTWSKVRSLIKNLESEYNYQFVFLGADINAGDVAENMGINREASAKFRKTSGKSGGVQSNFRAVNAMMDSVAEGENVAKSAVWKKNIVTDNN